MPVDDTWTSRDYPVLEAAVRGVDAGRMFGGIRFHEIADQTGLTADDVYVAARALEDAGLVENSYVMPGTHSRIKAVSGTARQLVGSWPSEETLADRILEITEAMLQADITDAERSRWQAIRDGALGAGRDILVQLAAAAMTGQLPH